MRPLSKRAVILCCLLAMGMGYYYFALFLPRVHAVRATRDLMRGYVYGCDFYPLWLTSHELLSHRTNPYTREMTTRIQMGLFGRTMDPQRPGDPLQNLAVFPHPLYADFLIAPLAAFSFPRVQAIGLVLFPLLVVAVVFLWQRILKLRLTLSTQLAIVVLTLTSYPVLEGIYALQLSLIVAALLAGSIAALLRGRLALAGALLALASVKPQLILLPALYLALWAASDLKARKPFLQSLLGALAFLFAASELVLPGWSATWIHALLEYRQYNAPSLALLVFGSTAGTLVSLGLLTTATVFAFRAHRANAGSPQFAATLAFLMAVTVPILPSSIAVYDQILLLPAILLLLSRKDQILRERRSRILGYVGAMVISWQWIVASAVAWFSFFLFTEIRNSVWLLLPLRMASSVPFAVVALGFFLTWDRDVSTKPAKSPAPSH